MKMIIAVIKPQMLDAVRSALTDMNVNGMTATDVRGYGRQKGHTEVYRGTEYNVDFRPKVKLEIAVTDDMVDAVVAEIQATANTGTIGDGKIFVLDLLSTVRIRTGDLDENAL